MEIIRKIKDLKIDQTKTIGYVPTMGALHEGHKSLIKKARENASKKRQDRKSVV